MSTSQDSDGQENARIEAAILDQLAARGPGKTLCPSEIARALVGENETPEAWRERMPDVREAAARLLDAGRIAVTQRGEPVDPRAAHGPIRLGPPASGTPR